RQRRLAHVRRKQELHAAVAGRARRGQRRHPHLEIRLLETKLGDALGRHLRQLLRRLLAQRPQLHRLRPHQLLRRRDAAVQPRQRALDVTLRLQPPAQLVARRRHRRRIAAMLPRGLQPRVHAVLQILGLLGIKVQLPPQRLELRAQVGQRDARRHQPVRQRLARRVQLLQLPGGPQQPRDTRRHPVVAGQSARQRRRQLQQLLRAAHALKIPLQRLDRLLAQVELVQPRQLRLQKRNLVRLQPRLAGQLRALRLQRAPGVILFPIRPQRVARATEQIEQLQLTRFLEQPARLARTVKIHPALAQPLQRRQRGQPAVDRDARRLLARQYPLEQQHPVLAGRQFQLGQRRVDARRLGEKQRGLHLARRLALPDDRLVGTLAGQQRQRAQQDALARARL